MKNKYYLLILGCIPLWGFTQTYVPLPDSGVIWSQNHSGIYCPNILYLCSEYQYTINGDTIIGSITYKKVFRSGYNYDTNIQATYFFEYAGGIRQNIPAKKVYYIENSSSQEDLLYDFDLAVGDTLQAAYNVYAWDNITVASIDTVLVGNEYRKRYNLSNTGTGAFALIEGIGSDAGLIEPLWQFEDNYYLACYNLHDTIIYPSGQTYLCGLITGINEADESENSALIFPNPSYGFILINSVCDSRLEIYNNQGSIIYRNILHNSLSRINLLKQPTGVYYYRMIEDNGKIHSGKFLLIN